MKFCMLASSSSGNCSVVQAAGTTLLIDAGISARRTTKALHALELEERIDAVLVTHEHSDHCKELAVIARRFGCPIYATPDTLTCMEDYLTGAQSLVPVTKGKPFALNGLEVVAFSLPHDAVDPCGYTVFDGKRRVGVATDLGTLTEEVQRHLSGCDAVSLEANHDLGMLLNGTYPQYLKERIQSDVGHLSNDQAGQALSVMGLKERLRHVILAHLSEHNNRPDLALRTVRKCLETYELQLDVHLSHKVNLSAVIEL